MNILIVGCGKVGSYLARVLEKLGHDVSLVDRSSSALNPADNIRLEGFSGLSAASLCSREHPEEAAQRLFALLREADELGKQLVIALWNSQTGIGLSVTNRLLRASGFTILLPHGEIEAGGKIISY